MLEKGEFRMSVLRVSLLYGILALTAFSSGCVVIKEYAPPKESIKATALEYELSRKLLQAFIKNDAKGFIALLPEETRSKYTVKSFQNTRKAVVDSVGEPVAYTYVTTLKLAALNPQIWKVTVRRQNINKTKEYTSEILFKVVTGMTSSKEAIITGFQFL